jgi:hypothetical protein
MQQDHDEEIVHHLKGFQSVELHRKFLPNNDPQLDVISVGHEPAERKRQCKYTKEGERETRKRREISKLTLSV